MRIHKPAKGATMKLLILILITAAALCPGQDGLIAAIDLTVAGRYEAAHAAIAKYLQDHPNDDRANYVKALVLTFQGKYRYAVPDIERAISIKNDKAEYHHLAAQLYEITGESDKAISAWERCRSSSGDSKLFVEAKNHIDFLKKDE
jgi:tetratricopeptide (TPR) repeat protein